MSRDDEAHDRLREAAFDTAPVPQVVVDGAGHVAAVNATARLHFGLSNDDCGRPLSDLEISYRPAELRQALDRVAADRNEVTIRDVRWSHGGEAQVFDVHITPIGDRSEPLLGSRIAFFDVTPLKIADEQLQHCRQEIETAYEELQSTNEELETTNEELQSTVEELETTNEELQSTNEELETMNEELHSTNEELQTMNDELRVRSTELNSANAFLESVFGSLRTAVVVIDTDYKVLVWSPRAVDLWGLRQDEATKAHVLNLDIGLPVGDLRAPLRAVLKDGAEHEEVVVAATNRRGKAIGCRVSISPLRQQDQTVSGAILLMEERPLPIP